VKTFYGLLAAVAVVAFVVYLVRLRLSMRRASLSKHARREFLKREGERDRHACLAAAKALDSGTAPRDGFVLAEAGNPARSGPAGENLSEAIRRRRRAATSTAFDPDLPAG
jgi:hypothetical protein